jgi:hypothetical protein
MERQGNGPFDTFRVTVKNVGSVNILGVHNADGQGSVGSISGQPIAMTPGQEAWFQLGSGWKGEVIEGKYSPDRLTQIEVTGVVFEDGSYEGDRGYAFRVLKYQGCAFSMAPRIAKLFRTAMNSTTVDLKAFRDRVLALNTAMDRDRAKQISDLFPEHAEEVQKPSACFTGVLSDLDTFIWRRGNSPTFAQETADWLKSALYRHTAGWLEPGGLPKQ